MLLLSLYFSLKAVTLHTDLGDVKIELFCERTPKACEVRQLETKLNGMCLGIEKTVQSSVEQNNTAAIPKYLTVVCVFY